MSFLVSQIKLFAKSCTVIVCLLQYNTYDSIHKNIRSNVKYMSPILKEFGIIIKCPLNCCRNPLYPNRILISKRNISV